jgi:hypothetical protein
MVASPAAAVAAVQSSKEAPRLPGLEYEERRAAARRGRGREGKYTLPTGPYTFGRFQVRACVKVWVCDCDSVSVCCMTAIGMHINVCYCHDVLAVYKQCLVFHTLS